MPVEWAGASTSQAGRGGWGLAGRCPTVQQLQVMLLMLAPGAMVNCPTLESHVLLPVIWVSRLDLIHRSTITQAVPVGITSPHTFIPFRTRAVKGSVIWTSSKHSRPAGLPDATLPTFHSSVPLPGSCALIKPSAAVCTHISSCQWHLAAVSKTGTAWPCCRTCSPATQTVWLDCGATGPTNRHPVFGRQVSGSGIRDQVSA